MLDAIFAAATGKVVLIASVVFVLSSVALDRLNPKNGIRDDLREHYVATDNPTKTEGSLSYSTARVTQMLGRYEPKHYEAHESFILLYDLVYPLCYGIAGALLLAYLCPWRGGGARWLVLLPPAAMAFDYVENFTMLAFLRRFRANPDAPLALLEVSRAFTVAKQCLLILTLAALALFLFGSVVSRFRTRPPAP